MIKFPHISLLRNVLDYVEHVNTDLLVPVRYRIDKPVTFQGSIKLHGANCGVMWDLAADTLQAQTREADLTPTDDYKGFAKFVVEHQDAIRKLIKESILPLMPLETRQVVLYGEWVGAGVIAKPKGVAVAKFDPKHWALFSVFVQVEQGTEPRNVSYIMETLPVKLGDRIGNVHAVGKDWRITIDFNDPASVEAGIVKVTEFLSELDKQCPYGAAYGLTGLGEGIVWLPLGDFFGREDLYWKFKTKAHSVVLETKVKQDRPALADDVQTAIRDFVDATVTENRLEQGLDALEQQGLTPEKRNTGHYLKWISEDVRRECVLELKESGLTWEQVSGAVTTRAREYFLAPRG